MFPLRSVRFEDILQNSFDLRVHGVMTSKILHLPKERRTQEESPHMGVDTRLFLEGDG